MKSNKIKIINIKEYNKLKNKHYSSGYYSEYNKIIVLMLPIKLKRFYKLKNYWTIVREQLNESNWKLLFNNVNKKVLLLLMTQELWRDIYYHNIYVIINNLKMKEKIGY